MADEDPADHIYVGSFYEILHSKLPPKSPQQLYSIRLALVNERTRTRVSLRFPSIYSLMAYFSETSKSDAKTLPQLDEKCIIRPEIAAETLYRRVSHQEITHKKKLWHFWVVHSISSPRLSISSPPISRSRSLVVSTKKGCLSEIESTAMVKWGQRRQVRYLDRHKGKSVISCKASSSKGEIEAAKENDEQEEDDEEEEEDEEIADLETREKGKRKQLPRSCKVNQKNKRHKGENKKQIVVYKHKKKKVLKNSIDRWSAPRYKLAEVNMLKIMKEQGAIFGRPILRPELRAHARKLIGDTGLLDHLLKHMAGKVAPGGEERFRRRHNAEGAMEYWLEKADLVEIRREAGVQDPYWTPPPGWHPGDNTTQDPICAREFKSLKEDISVLERKLEMLLSKKNEEEPPIVPTLLKCLQEMYIDLMNKKAKLEEQMIKISHSLCWMEGENEKMKTQLEESKRSTEASDAALIALPETASTATELKEKALARKEKVAKIERLRCGFRICKPQGTFLLPNGSLFSPQASVLFEDMFSVPTPPSVSSTTAMHPRLLPSPTSPVKPLAIIRAISSPLSCQSNASKSSMINLNEVPSNQNNSGSQCNGQNSSVPVTYQRRSYNAIACLEAEKKEMNQWWEGDQVMK